ncbi:hemicentin-1-like isoform X1 [Mizuhopecten yessoensis]|uniref:hemicentin-1-like isoform X1 n=1 Tax=Mizuhopecten yessoensis TaxID=6573 RepID=UPI000B458389|nr:hemicentin-1-like isoform X1 [Mizuhopecten yessoensis]
MLIAKQRIIWLLVLLLHTISFGIGVELTATPSPVSEGGSLTLTCSVTGNSSVFASFNYEDGRSIGIGQLSGGQCLDGSTAQPCNQQCNCTTDGKSFSVTISSVTRSWDKARIRCLVANPTATYSDIIVVSVINPPTGTLIVAPSGTQSVLTGTQVTLQCQVGGGNPLATLTWQCKGSPVTGQDLTNTTTAVSSLTFTVDSTYHQQQCVCTAGHQASPNGQFGTVSVAFNILYAPTVETFAIHYTSPFYKGDNVYIDCKIDGGNPLATLSWTCVDQSKETSTNMDTKGRAVSRLTITSITEVYNSRQCTCTATHLALSPSLTKSAVITVYCKYYVHVGLSPSLTKSTVITVYYPPSTPALAVDTTNGGTLPWLDRPTFTGILTCTTTAGNPPTTRISWYNNGVIDPGQSAITRRFDPPDKDYNGHTFTCRADNNYTDTKDTSVVSNGLVLDIEYDPIITLDKSTAYINESQSFSRPCSAEGNPSPAVSWYRDTTLVQSHGTLQFSRTDRQDSGTYTCTATARSTNGNILLQSTKLFNVIIRYGPDVSLVITNTTENTTNVHVVCTANGVPDQYTYRWTHMFGSTVIRDTFDQVTSSGSVSTLSIPRMTYEDMGTYVCEVDNGFRGRDGEVVQKRQGFLSVQGSPKIIGAHGKYVAEKDNIFDINITYVSFSAPVNTTILRPDSTLPPQSELSITVSSVPVTVAFYNKDVPVDGYMVNLHFSKFESKHRGHYRLYVRNIFDDRDYNFEIIISGRPEPPLKLVISQITSHSAVVSWNPGNDHDNAETFTLTYQEHNGLSTTYVTLDRTTTAFTIEQLLPSTQYDVSVFAVNDDGTSEALSGAFVTPQESSNTGVALISVGSAMILLSLFVFAVTLFMLRRGRLPYTKQRETNKSSLTRKTDRQVETGGFGQQGYEDLNLEQIEPPTLYDEVSNNALDNYNNAAGQESNTYEDLQRKSEANPYADIPPKPGTGLDRLYVNTSID